MARMCHILYLAAIAVICTNATTDYCNLGSCTRMEQTMCKYPSPNPSSKCVNWKGRGLNATEIKAIVNKHNELRQKVASGKETRGKPGPQPAAAYMPNLSWDDELAMVAQRWVDQCLIQHDRCRNVPRYAVGQNLAWTGNSAENNTPVEKMVLMWYDEVALFNNNEVKKFTTSTNFKDVGHYTQLVWAKTTKIGCGRIKWTENGWNNNMLICNYGPSGNYIGQPIYEIKK